MKFTEFSVDQDLDYKSFSNFYNFQTLEKNLFIFGKPGVGKTEFLKNTYKKMLNYKITIKEFEICKYKIEFFNVNEWIKDIQKSWKKEFDGSLQINTSADILLIDDLGSEFFHQSTATYILDLFESRYEYVQKNKNTITLISSNYSLEQLKQKYLKEMKDEIAIERLFSRIEGIIEKEILFFGTDKRIKRG